MREGEERGGEGRRGEGRLENRQRKQKSTHF